MSSSTHHGGGAQDSDGMLASPLTSATDACRIWQAFAQFGVGVGASGTVSGGVVTISESYAVPASCQ